MQALVWLFRFLKSLYTRLRLVRQFILKEIELNGYPKTWRKLRFVLSGFHSDKIFLYQHGPNGLPLPTYFSDFDRLKTKRLNGRYAYALDDKILFNNVFDGLFKCPTNFGFINKEGLFKPLSTDLYRYRNYNLEKILTLLPAHLVFKRVGGGGGKYIYTVERTDSGYIMNGKPASLDEISTAIQDRRFLVSDYIRQGQYANALFSKSVNTVRAVTINYNGKPWIGFAVQRIGRKESAPTDNFNRGGLCAPIDLETGELGEALYYSGTSKPKAFTNHPDTGVLIKGQIVPRWHELCRELLNLVSRNPGFQYVGWDVVILDDGFMFLEGNSYPGVQVIQLHRPLLEIPGMAHFYYEQGVISKRKLRKAGFKPLPAPSAEQTIGNPATQLGSSASHSGVN